ncbi:MAG: ABC transporter permease [Acidobacteria bacterium]|nr:ABC transporter permease [Acidobacteriota bacterium]
MDSLNELLQRLTGLFLSKQANRRIAEETEFHLRMLRDKYRAQGLSDHDAAIAARREFGSTARMQEDYRAQSSFGWMDTLRGDVLYAVRTLGKTPGITALMILMLGLGIGANTAIFSFLSELLLRPLPYRDPDRVVVVGRWRNGTMWATSPRDFAALRDKTQTLESVTTSFLYRGVNLETAAEPRHVPSIHVTHEYFRTIGVAPQLGRAFLPEEDKPGGPHVTVLSYSLWTDAYQSDANILGRQVRINGAPHTIVGVLPEAFSARARAKLYLPLQSTLRGTDTNYTILARLAPGATAEQASAEVDSLFAVVDAERAQRATKGQPFVRTPGRAISAQEDSAGEFRSQVLLLFGAVSVMLFVACLNTANLLLARSAARTREIAIRCALGAGRGRITRQLLTESLMLSVLGGLSGIGLGHLFITGLARLSPYDVLRHVSLDQRALVFTAAVSILVGLLFGLAPALHAFRLGLGESLQQNATRVSAGRGTLMSRQVLVIAQVALCTILVAGAGLLVRTVLNIRSVSTGFDTRNLLVSPMVLNADKLESVQALVNYYEQASRQMREVPGVLDVAYTNQLPYEGQFNLPIELPDTATPDRTMSMQFRMQSPDTFRVLGMKIVRGRDFAQSDTTGAPQIAIVNEAFARQFYPQGDVLGKRITMKNYLKVPDVFTIGGVVTDVREMGPKRPVPPAIYVVAGQLPLTVVKGVFSFVSTKWIVKVQPGVNNVIPQLRRAAGSLDPSQPFVEFTSMDTVVASSARLERVLMTLLAAFAGLTLLMVAAGIYGTMAYMVSLRKQEIGIRMALGARPRDVMAIIVASGARQVIAGLMIGFAVAWWATKWMTTFLFQLKATDPANLATAAAILLLAGVLACAGPARTALKLAPIKTLRMD